MTETDILNLVEHRQWLLLSGLIIMALVTAFRTFAARAGWTGTRDKAVSVVGSYLQDLSIMLPAFGYDLWPWAFLGALRGVLMSGGLSELLAMVVTKNPPAPGPSQTPSDRVTPRLGGTPLPRPTGSSSASSTLRMAVVVAAVALLSACSGGPIVPDPHPGDGVEPCEVEASIVESLDAAVDAVDAEVPDDAPKAADALAYARAGVLEGEAAIGACRALTSEGGSGLAAVLPWITVAANVVRGLMSILAAIGIDIPDALEEVLHSLGLARAELGADVDADVAKTAVPIERYAPATW